MARVVHFEIPLDDVDKGLEFYKDVFDWDINGMEMDNGMTYYGAHTGPTDDENMTTENGFINGGLFKRMNPGQQVTFFMHVDDIDATLKQVTDHGGEVQIAKMPVMEMGFVAYFKDPSGNVIGLWQDASK